MKFANRKLAVMLVSMVSLPVIQSTIAAPLNTHERAYLAKLISLASTHATQLSGQLHAFFDKSNRESYRKHVDGFESTLRTVNDAIIRPLETEMETTSNTEYRELLAKMYAIAIELRKNLSEAHGTFHKNEGNSIVTIMNALRLLKDKVGNRLPQLEQKLKDLHRSLLTVDKELAQEIDTLQKTLPKIFDIKLSNMVLVTCVQHRMKCS